MLLVECELIAECASANLKLAFARFMKVVNNPFQKRSAITESLMGRLHSNTH